ncbi:hypothetical protein [Streptomyces sp. NPDC051561]|uniref:hypothetical protein n=1 Tax=Streptomyces sp. NPDC051561 TaxID=3365658 RepID=UPI0037B9C2DA
MRRTRDRRRAPGVALTAAVLVLTGCGIQETDVVEAGAPATADAFYNDESDILLFFRSPDGRVTPVIRTNQLGKPGAPDSLLETEQERGGATTEQKRGGGSVKEARMERAVKFLLSGPGREDRAAGLTTALPAARAGGTLRVQYGTGGVIIARLPLALRELDSTALRQLTCTVAYREDWDGQATVELTGQDGVVRSGTCGLIGGSVGGEPEEPSEPSESVATDARTEPGGATG